MSPSVTFFLVFAFSLAMWASSTYMNALSGAARAGLLDGKVFLKVGVPAVLMMAFACMVIRADFALTRLDYFFLLGTAASLSNSVYVILIATAHGVDYELAQAMMVLETAKLKQISLGEFADPVKLQAYLDKSYGRGKLNARLILADKKAAVA